MKTTRRSFLARALAAIATVPLWARAATKSNKLAVDDYKTIHVGPPSGLLVRVEGLAVKVPSNRWHRCVDDIAIEGQPLRTAVEYVGDWDGTFKLERGCANPAYILADLYERTGVEPDWVIGTKWRVLTAYSVDYTSLFKAELNWQMLYDYGRWCDEMVVGFSEERLNRDIGYFQMGGELILKPRFTVNTVCQTRADMDRLRETLRMFYLQWQSTDLRYRTSYPGIPYPEVGA